MTTYDVAVVGGGASGLTAAISAARSGARVIIMEKNPRVGKKILATGNGRCNLSNQDLGQQYFFGSDPAFAGKTVAQFGLRETISFFNSLGLVTTVEDGRLYPRSMQASSVLDVLRHEIEHLGVVMRTESRVLSIASGAKGYRLKTTQGAIQPRTVILSTGGQASPQFGSSGDGYTLAKRLGHEVVTPCPALVGLRIDSPHTKALAGLRVEATIHAAGDAFRESGELIFTKDGISGIPVLNLTSALAQKYAGDEPVEVVISLEKGSQEALKRLLAERFNTLSHKTLLEALIGYLPKQLGPVMLKEAEVDSLQKKAGDISAEELRRLCDLLLRWPLSVAGTGNWEQAQTTCGGVRTSEVNPDTLESLLCPGLYFAGELLDVHGSCGGYNLQWAWSSGYIAGSNAAVVCSRS